MKRTFQSGNRYWTIERTGKRLTTTWGINGGKQQSRVRTCVNEVNGDHELFTQAWAKLKAGYVETTFRGDLSLDDPIAQGLIASLIENPDDLAAHMAFADWLSEQADDRLAALGEFMRLQLAQERQPPSSKRKTPEQKRIAELLDAYEIHWLGEKLATHLFSQQWPLVQDDVFELLWPPHRQYARGWLTRLGIHEPFTAGLARAMKDARALALMQTLEIHDAFDGNYLRLLAGSPMLGNVRKLVLCDSDSQADLVALIQSLPRLESLHIAMDEVKTNRLFELRLPNLRTLEVSASTYSVAKLVGNPSLTKLRRLALNTVSDPFVDIEMFDRGFVSGEDVELICYSPHLRSLEELVLHHADVGEDGCVALVGSGILGRLKLLDLSYGDLIDEGAEILAASPDFARIPHVQLEGNELSSRMVRRLRRINKGVEAKEQLDPDPEEAFESDWE